MIRRALLATTALVAAGRPAAADPIFTPLIASALATVGISGTVATVAASVISAVAVTAIGVGVSLLFAPKPPKPENGSIAIQQTIPFRIWGVGTAKVPGAVMFKEQVNGYLGVVAALNAHQVSAFRGLYLNDDLVNVPVTTDGFLSGAVGAGSDGRYKNNAVSISTRKGVVPETSYTLISNVFGTLWDANHRGDGIASIAMLCSPEKSTVFQTIYPYEAPQAAAIVDQALVFDPRDTTQSPTNAGTWKFSDNAALCLLWFLCFCDFGPRRDYTTAILPVLSRWIAAANVCDEQAALKAGGTESRYRVAGWMTTEQDRKTGEAAIRSAMDGWTVTRGDGSIDVEAGRYYEPDVIITDDDILSWSGQRGVASKDRINSFTARYLSPENGYVTVETSRFDDTADQAKRAGPPRSSQMDLSWVPATGQASRLIRREYIRQGETTRGTLVLALSGLNAAYARRIRVQSNSIPRLSDVVLEVSRPVISLTAGTVTLNYIGVGSEIDAYTPATMESAPPAVPQRPVSTGLPIPANVSIVPEQNGSSVYLSVSFDQPLDANGNGRTDLSYQVEYRLHNAGGGVPGSYVPQTFTDYTVAAGRITLATSPVPVGVLLDVDVSSIATGATLSTASPTVEVDTSLTAPGEPTLSATGSSGKVALSGTNPSSSNFASIQIYRNSTGGSFATAQAVGQPIAGTAGGAFAYTDTVAAGSYDYFATALSTGGVASAPVGPTSATAT